MYILGNRSGEPVTPEETLESYFTDIFFKNQ
jgi:hypothetical protein